MPRAICPVCDADVRLGKADVVLGKRVTCSECGATLEVVDEDSFTLEEVGYAERGDLW